MFGPKCEYCGKRHWDRWAAIDCMVFESIRADAIAKHELQKQIDSDPTRDPKRLIPKENK